LPRDTRKRRRSLISGRGCAPYRGAPAFRRFDRGSRRDSHPCSTPGHASWDLESSGRYPPYPVPVQWQHLTPRP